MMTYGDPEGRIFLSYPHTNNGFLFLLTAVFIYLFIYLLSILKYFASRSPWIRQDAIISHDDVTSTLT